MATTRKRRTYPKKHRDLINQARPYYEQMLLTQQGHCALCPREPSERRRLDIDHDHQRMVIRGLLCHRCNRALKEWMTSEWLKAASKYVLREVKLK